jgi:hypothetical protein
MFPEGDNREKIKFNLLQSNMLLLRCPENTNPIREKKPSEGGARPFSLLSRVLELLC